MESDKLKVIRADGKNVYISANSGKIEPGDVIIVKENFERKFLSFAPIFLSLASISIVIATLMITTQFSK